MSEGKKFDWRRLVAYLDGRYPFTANQSMGNNKLTGLAAGSSSGDSARYDELATAIQKDGSVTYTADQPMGSNKLTGLAAGSASGHSARYDELVAVTKSEPAYAINTLTYQNTSGKVKIVVVTGNAQLGNGTVELLYGKIGSSSPASDTVSTQAFSWNGTINEIVFGFTVVLVVPVNYYYGIEGTNNNSPNWNLGEWTEYNLH